MFNIFKLICLNDDVFNQLHYLFLSCSLKTFLWRNSGLSPIFWGRLQSALFMFSYSLLCTKHSVVLIGCSHEVSENRYMYSFVETKFQMFRPLIFIRTLLHDTTSFMKHFHLGIGKCELIKWRNAMGSSRDDCQFATFF